jgi:flagellar basal body rod protein FlgC
MKIILKILTFLYALKVFLALFSENTSIKKQIDRLKEEITKIETDDIENKIKNFFKKYDPNNPNYKDI